MPRIKSDPDPRLVAIRARLTEFISREHRGNQSDFARKSGVSQYQVSRLLSGRMKSLTSDAEKLCRYANININIGIENIGNARLLAALDKVNDGRKETIDFLVNLLELAAPLIRTSAGQQQTRSKEYL